MQVNDRVALARDPSWTGTVESIDKAGLVCVVFDGSGGHGRFRPDALVEAEDKSWPPKGMEHKGV